MKTADHSKKTTSNGIFSSAEVLRKKNIQTKLKVSEPGDPYEREADRIADKVMSMPAPAAGVQNTAPAISRLVQRQEEEEVQASPFVSRQEEEEEETLQTMPWIMKQEEEEEMQTKPDISRQPVEEEEEMMQMKGEGSQGTVEPWIGRQLQTGNSGDPMPQNTRNFMEGRFGADFGNVRIHNDERASQMNNALNARAFTNRNHIYFKKGQYDPGTGQGKHLLAHELTHVVQQGGAAVKRKVAGNISRNPGTDIHRAVSFDVSKWTAQKLGPPAITNGTDPRRMRIPPSGQIRIRGKVRVNGAAGDNCSGYSLGTTQTAWSAWTRITYRGRTSSDGSVTLTHRPPMPMRDPADNNSVWYEALQVVNPATCGSDVDISHFDSPWHEFPKATPNDAVTGSPLNFLRVYERGLHLVTYLTVRDPAGNFLTNPLKYRYWNTQQRYTFTPQYPSPPSNTAFLGTWPSSGGITVNIGSKGDGEVADAPHYETTGTEYNPHFNNSTNWNRQESS